MEPKRLGETSNHSASLAPSKREREATGDSQVKIQPMGSPIPPRNMLVFISLPRSVVGWEPPMKSKAKCYDGLRSSIWSLVS